MNPRDWEKEIPVLRVELVKHLSDAGTVDRMLHRLIDESHLGRVRAWDRYVDPVFGSSIKKHPGLTKTLRHLEQRLYSVYMTGNAADAPDRIRALM